MPARTKCSPRSPQTSRRTVEKTHTRHERHTSVIPELPQAPHVSCAAHREVLDSTRVLQQLLKRDSPGQHSVGWVYLSSRNPWKAWVAASTAPRGHVQLYTACSHTHIFSSAEKQDREWDWIRHFLLWGTITHRHASGGRNPDRSGSPPSETAWLWGKRETKMVVLMITPKFFLRNSM